MAKDRNLFKDSGGSVVRGYIMLKQNPGSYVRPSWYERYAESRKKLHPEIVRILKEGKITEFPILEKWEEDYQKECFYYGIRCLLDLEREGATEL